LVNLTAPYLVRASTNDNKKVASNNTCQNAPKKSQAHANPAVTNLETASILISAAITNIKTKPPGGLSVFMVEREDYFFLRPITLLGSSKTVVLAQKNA
jgi:hypothetical protein